MSKEENNYKLLLSIISQMSTKGQLRGINWSLVAADLGLERAQAANLRWTRFKKATGLNLSDSKGGASGILKTTRATRGGGIKKAGAGKGKGRAAVAKKSKKGEDDEAYAGDEGTGSVSENGEGEVKVEAEEFYEAQEDGSELGPEYEEMYEDVEERNGQAEQYYGYGGELQAYGAQGEVYGDDGYGKEA
jgi:hypothetical protein